MRWRSSAGFSAARQIGLDLEDVRAFQVHLVAGGMSWPALNQTVCALRFFYGVTLGQAEICRSGSPMPASRASCRWCSSADEVVRFLEAVPGLKHRAALTTAYAAGLRVSEVGRAKVADIDSSRMVIRVEQGKGGKDRYVMLSPQLLGILRSYWRLTRPAIGCSLAATRIARSTRPRCTAPADRPGPQPGWTSG